MPILKNLKISEELHTQLRLSSIHSSVTLQRMVEMIIEQWYASRNKD